LKYSFRWVLLPALIVAVLFTQTGCKENTLINAQVSPSDDEIGVYSTSLTCITHTYFDDTGVMGLYIPNSNNYMGVGALTDDFFGTMTGAANFQVLPEHPSIAVYNDMTIDSAVLIMPYSGYTFGDTSDQSATQTYQAFLLTEDVTPNTLYYSFTSKAIDVAKPLSEPVSVNLYHLKDSVSVNNVNYHPGLRLKLNLQTLLTRLLPALTLATNNADPNPAFHSIFKGVCLKVGNSNQFTKAYPFFRLDGTTDYSGAGILVYYHPNGSAGNDSLHHRYFFNSENCGFFNNVKKSYSHYPVNSLFTSVQANDSVIALQNQPGANLDILITGINSLPSGVINKAELQLTLLPGYHNNFTVPTRLYPLRISNGVYPAGTIAGGSYNVEDRYPESSRITILDGHIHDFTRDGVNVQTYTIGLPREIMSCRAAKNDTLHLRLTGTQDFIGAYRAVLGGGNHPNPVYRAKLFVVYSSLN
jgi:hypothetical protein